MTQACSPRYLGTWGENTCAHEFKTSLGNIVIYEDLKNKINTTNSNNKIFIKPRNPTYDLHSSSVKNSDQAKKALFGSRAWHSGKGSFRNVTLKWGKRTLTLHGTEPLLPEKTSLHFPGKCRVLRKRFS